jgi:hypothetical protein
LGLSDHERAGTRRSCVHAGNQVFAQDRDARLARYGQPVPPDARELVQGLVDSTLQTLARQRPNVVLAIEGPHGIIGTAKSHEGEPVALPKIQDGLAVLSAEREVRITPATFDGYRRSSFIGALLGTLDGAGVETCPLWVRLLDYSAAARPPGAGAGLLAYVQSCDTR